MNNHENESYETNDITVLNSNGASIETEKLSWRLLTIKAIIAYIIVFYILPVILQSVLSLIYPLFSGEPAVIGNQFTDQAISFISIWQNICMYFAAGVAILLIMKPLILSDLHQIKHNPRIWLLVPIGYGLFMLSNVINELLNRLFIHWHIISSNTTSNNQATIVKMITDSSTFETILLCFVLIVLAPVVEEIIFRKGLFTLIGNKMKPIGKIVLTGSIFGGIHFILTIIEIIIISINTGSFDTASIIAELAMGVFYIISGMTLSFIYYMSHENLIPSTICHLVNNLFQCIAIVGIKLGMIDSELISTFIRSIINL